MDFDQLATFVYVAKLKSFSRAGQKVFRSQSAVSAQIRQLEQAYGDRLLDRSGKDVTLTPAGRALFAKYCSLYPGVQISIYRNFSYKIVEKLENGSIDVGIVTMPVKSSTLKSHP